MTQPKLLPAVDPFAFVSRDQPFSHGINGCFNKAGDNYCAGISFVQDDLAEWVSGPTT